MQRGEKMYLWLEEQGLICQPEESKEEKVKRFEEYLNSVAARNKLTHKGRRDTLIKRGRAV